MLCVAFLLVIAQAAAQSNTLVLTDYILAGNAAGGKNASKVTSENLLASDLVSYSGYFRISMNPFRHLFFWFFPCEYQPQNKPLLLWLQGGPGQSAMVAIMEEFGPFVLNGDISAVRYSPNSWTQDYNILFFDNPIGTGFSFSNASADSSYSATVEDVADNLYHALIQFFMVFPEFRTNRFYIAGESYAGKYVPTLAYQIMNYNSRPTTSIRINLKDLLIFSGLIDASYQLKMSHVAKQWGFINNHTQNLYLETEEQEWAGLIASGQTVEADQRWYNGLATILKMMNYYNLYNAQDDNYPTLGSFPEYFVTGTAIKQALHVGSRTYYPHDDFTVRDSMLADVMRSAKQTLQAVLPSRKVLFINGNLDLMVPPAHNEWMFADIEPSYNWTRRSFVRVEGKVMGYIKKAGNLVTAVLRNCGHYLPRDCPRSTKKVVKKFLAGTL